MSTVLDWKQSHSTVQDDSRYGQGEQRVPSLKKLARKVTVDIIRSIIPNTCHPGGGGGVQKVIVLTCVKRECVNVESVSIMLSANWIFLV
jgi:hypothetical protein